MLCVLILVFGKDDTIEIAADEVADNDTCIYSDDLNGMNLPESERNAEVIEGIGHAVGEAAYDEERHTEKEREVLLLAGKLNGCGHYEAASYTQKSATDGSGTKAKLEDPLSGCLNFQWSHACKKRSYEASYDVSEKDHEQLSYLAFVNESGCTCIKFQPISHDSEKSEGEEHCTDKASILVCLDTCCQKTESRSSDADSGEY